MACKQQAPVGTLHFVMLLVGFTSDPGPQVSRYRKERTSPPLDVTQGHIIYSGQRRVSRSDKPTVLLPFFPRCGEGDSSGPNEGPSTWILSDQDARNMLVDE